MLTMSSAMPPKKERKKVPAKSVYTHIIRSKLYCVLTVNALEGIIHEIDDMLSVDEVDDTIDVFSNRFRRYQNGALMPTSYGDHLDRAAKSLCRDLGLNVTIELFNTQAIKRVISSVILAIDDPERSIMIDWLSLPNEIILKSERYENLINDACLFYYKESVNNINDDTLAFVRRSANELLRNKSSKDSLIKKLKQIQSGNIMQLHPLHDLSLPQAYGNDMSSVDPNQLSYMMNPTISDEILMYICSY